MVNQSNACHFTIQSASPTEEHTEFFIKRINNFFAYYLLKFFSSSIKSRDKLPLKSVFFFSIHPCKFKYKAARTNLLFPLRVSSLGYEIIDKNWKKIKTETLFYDDYTEGQQHKFPGEF